MHPTHLFKTAATSIVGWCDRVADLAAAHAPDGDWYLIYDPTRDYGDD